MLKRLGIGWLLLHLCVQMAATSVIDSVVVRIDSCAYTVRQYKAFVQHVSGTVASFGPQSIDAFVAHLLFVSEAQREGMEHDSSVVDAWNDHIRDLVKRIRPVTKEEKNGGNRHLSVEGVPIWHLHVPLPQYVSKIGFERARQQMDSLYQLLASDTLCDVFEAASLGIVSDTTRLYPYQMPEEFESRVHELESGCWSAPFATAIGIHLVKRLPEPTLAVSSDQRHAACGERISLCEDDDAVQKLKVECGYIPDDEAIRNLLSGKKGKEVLFSIGGKQYTVADFCLFASAHPVGMKRCFRQFVVKSLWDYVAVSQVNSHLRSDEGGRFRDSLLIHAYLERHLSPCLSDSAALEDWFQLNVSAYRWSEPRYKGMLLHCADKKQARGLRKFLKKLPEAEWNKALSLLYTSQDSLAPHVERGVFARGDNAYVDELFFGKAPAEPYPDRPYAVWVGRKVREPDSYVEVLQQVKNDFEEHLKKRLLSQILPLHKVEINQQVLKKANNH